MYYFSWWAYYFSLVLVYAKKHLTFKMYSLLFFLMGYSVFKFSNPKSLSAKMRSSSPKYSTPLKNYIKLYLPVHLQMGFALSYIWSVWDCCWTGAEAVHRPSRQQRNFFLPLCLNWSICLYAEVTSLFSNQNGFFCNSTCFGN